MLYVKFIIKINSVAYTITILFICIRIKNIEYEKD